MSANFLYSADIQNTAASAVVTDNKLHDASIDDHCDNGHLAPNGDCIIGKNQAISADGQHAHQQKCILNVNTMKVIWQISSVRVLWSSPQFLSYKCARYATWLLMVVANTIIFHI